MNYNQYTTEELQKRLDIIKELKSLEGGNPHEPKKDDAPWYPNVKWVEYNPSMNIDRGKVIDALLRSERECEKWEPRSTYSHDFRSKHWDGAFNWKDYDGDIVAILIE